MTSKQYEELCRLYLATQLKIAVDEIHSLNLVNPSVESLTEFAHQIDLYWETENEVAKYVNIANAKWRRPQALIVQHEVLLLAKVRDNVRAHKALMITSVGYTSGAQAVAEHEGVGLHVVSPAFNPRRLERNDPGRIRRQLQELARTSGPVPMYVHRLVHKSFGQVASQEACSCPTEQEPGSGETGVPQEALLYKSFSALSPEMGSAGQIPMYKTFSALQPSSLDSPGRGGRG
jgi:hypothetical protein